MLHRVRNRCYADPRGKCANENPLSYRRRCEPHTAPLAIMLSISAFE
jgi:hypothetical protein